MTIWYASKGEDPLAKLEYAARNGGFDQDELFRAVLDQGIPVAEHISFNFVLEDVPISWREQAVRHRVGTKYGDNFAVDIIPEADLTFWSQSMRIQSMDDFAAEGKYYTPPSVAENPAASQVYNTTMGTIEAGYNTLRSLGIEMEDARNLIPLGATHRITMTVNLRALVNIVGKRGCWILQSSLWGPVIKGMIAELAAKVDPVFRRLAYPPCIRGGKFVECAFKHENERRVDGRDDMPVCPLYATSERVVEAMSTEQVGMTARRIPEYADLWDQPDLAKTWEWSPR